MPSDQSSPESGIINIFYSIELVRRLVKPFPLGTIPVLGALGEWFAKATIMVADLKRPTWNDEIRVYEEPEHKLIMTYRLGWVEVEPIEKNEPKPLIELVQ